MTTHVRRAVLVLAALTIAALVLVGTRAQKNGAGEWPVVDPAGAGLDSGALAALDADIAAGSYGLVDSMLILRDGKQALARSYPHDYAQVYGELAKHEGPLNHDVNGPYNYFSADFHPYYQHSDLHTMQSVSKTVTSITMGSRSAAKNFLPTWTRQS